LLSCEVERLSEINYALVKENELLKLDRSDDRITDLRNKVAIVLAENEKLNQIIDELSIDNQRL